jgi:hypothetical protein
MNRLEKFKIMNRLLTFALCSLLSCTFTLAQRKKSEPDSPQHTSSEYAEKIKGLKPYPGFMNYYFDEKNDKIFLSIESFDTEFVYIVSLPAGIGSNDIGLDRGQLGGERIVKFERRGPKVLMVQPNYYYRAITNNADEKRAVQEAFAQSVLWGFTVIAEEGGKVLVDATDFFLQDAHDVIGTLSATKQGNYHLDKSRSAFYTPRIKSFPENSEFEATLTFTGEASGDYIQSVTPTPNSVTVRQHHSFVKLPDANFTPRKFDPRAGYFDISYYDYATPIQEPIQKRFITRHRLEKKDPLAVLSEPVEPIVYYLDRGTPEPIRSALLDGARWWNQAFEAAGYKDAFKVEMLPEDADPMDVRYNLIQWVHRSTRGWSYGATVTDPRTGEIIKGHVTLGSLRVRQDFLIAEGLLAPYESGKPVPPEMEKMALARLRQLSAHEVGHTLGIAHAYSSSSENFASVMDYPHPNAQLVNGKIDLSNAYDTKIGAWDKVSIAFGYQDFPTGTNEEEALNALIHNALKSGLTFLSDQDARPRGGSHPYAHLWDNGSDAADELNRVLDIRAVALKNFGEKNIRMGYPMALLEEALVPMYFFHRYQTEATSKLIGGLNYRYALRGDGQPITEMISPAEQQKALDALLKTISPTNLMLPENVLVSIPPRPLGYDRHREVIKIRTELTFDALAIAESASELTFSLLLHPARAGRLVEYHARDTKQPSLESIINKVTQATFKALPKSGYEGAIQITVNEVLLRNLIKLATNANASGQVKGVVYLKLDQLKDWLTTKSKAATDETWKAHYTYGLSQIENFQKNPLEYHEEPSLVAPPGQPIGVDEKDFCGSN